MKNVIKNIPIIDNFIYQFILSIFRRAHTQILYTLQEIHAVCSLVYLVTVYDRAGGNDVDLAFYGT